MTRIQWSCIRALMENESQMIWQNRRMDTSLLYLSEYYVIHVEYNLNMFKNDEYRLSLVQDWPR